MNPIEILQRLQRRIRVRRGMKPRSFLHKYKFSSKAMRRGVQISLEKRQRPTRLALIAESQRQGNEVRRVFRERQLEGREGVC